LSNKSAYIETVKELVDVYREARSSDRGVLRPQIIKLIRKELVAITPERFSKFTTTQIDFIFLSVVLIEQNICMDLVRHLSKFWSDSIADSLRMKIQLEQSIESGPLSKLIEKDERDRLRVKPEYRNEIIETLIPDLQNCSMDEAVSGLILNRQSTGMPSL
jgi:hypothetical protein